VQLENGSMELEHSLSFGRNWRKARNLLRFLLTGGREHSAGRSMFLPGIPVDATAQERSILIENAQQ